MYMHNIRQWRIKEFQNRRVQMKTGYYECVEATSGFRALPYKVRCLGAKPPEADGFLQVKAFFYVKVNEKN
jgi:hypothetical protein